MPPVRYFKPSEKVTYLTVLDSLTGGRVHWSGNRFLLCEGGKCVLCENGERAVNRFVAPVVHYQDSRGSQPVVGVWAFGTDTYEQLRRMPRSSGRSHVRLELGSNTRFRQVTVYPAMSLGTGEEGAWGADISTDLDVAKGMCQNWSTVMHAPRVTKERLLTTDAENPTPCKPLHVSRYAGIVNLLMGV